MRESPLPQKRRLRPAWCRLIVTIASAVTLASFIAAGASQPGRAAPQRSQLPTAASRHLAASAQTTAATTTKKEAEKIGRWTLLVAALSLIFVLPLVLWLVELVVRALQRKAPTSPVVIGWIRGALIGADKRVSTSKTVMVVWTYSLASVLLAIVIAKLWGHPAALEALRKSGLQAEYAVLIGGPLGAAILAKGIVSNQVASGQSKPQSSDKAKATDLVNNDTGQTDLGDLQYVLFNAVALTFFFGQFLSNPLLGLPDMPDVLVGLTSVSAVGYLGKKALPSVTREITEVHSDPSPVLTTCWDNEQVVHFTVLGSGLLNADRSAPTEVRFENDADKGPASNVVASITGEGTTLEFDLADVLPEGHYALHIVTSDGNKITKADALTVNPAASA